VLRGYLVWKREAAILRAANASFQKQIHEGRKAQITTSGNEFHLYRIPAELVAA
jgi:hypothetical protein